MSQTYSPIHWTDFVSNNVVRSCMGQPLLSDTTSIRRRSPVFLWPPLSFHISHDHSRALQVCIRHPPKDWRCRTGRPRQTWL